MELQSYRQRDREITHQFIEFRTGGRPETGLALSWSNWGFGTEELRVSLERLARHGVRYVELHGNRYGTDLGYRSEEVRSLLDALGMKVSGVCGMVSPDSELSSNKPHITQRSIDYFKRNIEMCAELGGTYLLFTPGAVGRPDKYDENEAKRAADAIRILAPTFQEYDIKPAIEPVRAAEVSFCHTFAEAVDLITSVNHPAVQHICGDLYHMLAGEAHIAGTILEYGERIINLHMADSTRGALGTGCLDLDRVLMALYLVGYNAEGRFCTPEPLGPGGDPYPAMWGTPDPRELDELVRQTATCFREREEFIWTASDEELLAG